MHFVSHTEVTQLLPMNECIGLMRSLFSLPSEQVLNPLRTKMWLPDYRGVLGMMPSFIEPWGIMGIKVLSVFPENYKKGLSSHQGIVILFEAETGAILGSFDADSITAIRTAAVSALMTDLLALPTANSLALIGTGEQAYSHLEAISYVRSLQNVWVWSPTPSKREQFARTQSVKFGIEIGVKDSIEQTVAEADIVCTLTPSTLPVLKSEWIRPGTHINAVGASTPQARELDSELVARSRLFVDNVESAMNESGDILIPIGEELITQQHIVGAIADVLSNTCAGRTHADEITLFKSLGIGLEDLAVAHHIYKKLTHHA
ncbi:MAG: ornithine cyclodeaminase family protein [Spirosomataceae bacterium]